MITKAWFFSYVTEMGFHSSAFCAVASCNCVQHLPISVSLPNLHNYFIEFLLVKWVSVGTIPTWMSATLRAFFGSHLFDIIKFSHCHLQSRSGWSVQSPSDSLPTVLYSIYRVSHWAESLDPTVHFCYEPPPCDSDRRTARSPSNLMHLLLYPAAAPGFSNCINHYEKKKKSACYYRQSLMDKVTRMISKQTLVFIRLFISIVLRSWYGLQIKTSAEKGNRSQWNGLWCWFKDPG